MARAFTATPTGLVRAGAGESEVTLCGAVLMLRAALAEIDTAKQQL